MGLFSSLVEVGASGVYWHKTSLLSDWCQGAVWLVWPSWELLALQYEGAEGMHRVWLLVSGGGCRALVHGQYVDYSQSGMLVVVSGAVGV